MSTPARWWMRWPSLYSALGGVAPGNSMPRLTQSGSSVRGASGIIAGVPAGLSDQVEADNNLLRTIDALPLAQWPSWYMAQYDALIIQPHLKAEVLNSDENQPARARREGRAKVAGTLEESHIVPQAQPGKQVSKPNKSGRKGHPSWFAVLGHMAVGSRLKNQPFVYPPPGVRSADGVARRPCRKPMLPET